MFALVSDAPALLAAGSGVLVLLMMCAGGGSIGFISIGLRVTVVIGHPADEIFAGSIVELCAAPLCYIRYIRYIRSDGCRTPRAAHTSPSAMTRVEGARERLR